MSRFRSLSALAVRLFAAGGAEALVPLWNRHSISAGIIKRVVAVAVLLVATLSLGADCVRPTWTAGSILTRTATRVLAADVNGDDAPDVIGHTSGTIFVALNDGAGAFTTVTDVHTGTILGPVVAGDFTGDSKLDLAFATTGALVVRPGIGDGTFGTAIVSAITTAPANTLATNVDAGATLDLLVYDTTLAVLVRYTNDGSGQFSEASRTTIAANAVAFTAADFDGNGRTDAVVAYSNSSNYDRFLADANGAFGSASSIEGAEFPATDLKAVDIDNAGGPDLMIATSETSTTLLDNAGTFGEPVSYPSPPATGIHAVELNGDANVDLLTVGRHCSILYRPGTGDGTFDYDRSYFFVQSCSTDPHVHAATADFDGDGRNDVVLATRVFENEPSHIRILRNRCGDSEITATTPTLITAGDPAFVKVSIRPPGALAIDYPATGTVEIRKDGQTVATGPLDSGSRVTIKVPGLALGAHELVAFYAGNEHFEPNQSDPVTVTVVEQSTTTTLTMASTATYPGTPAISATVTAPGGQPTGRIRISIDDGSDHDYEGDAPTVQYPMFSFPPNGIGTHTVTALYLGDDTHPASSDTRTYTVVKQSPRLNPNRNTANAGQIQPLTISFLVFGALYDVYNRPTGTVTIGDGTNVWSTGNVSQYLDAELTVPALAAGRHTLVLNYSGDGYYNPVQTRVPWWVFPSTGESVDARGNAVGVTITWYSTRTRLRSKVAGEPWGTGALPCCASQPSLDNPPNEVPYLYRLESDDGVSPADVGMRFTFTDDVLVPGMRVKLVHLQEIVRAANHLRAAAGQSAISMTPFSPGQTIRASSIAALQTAINQARVALGAYSFPFANTIVPGRTIRAGDIQELREAVR